MQFQVKGTTTSASSLLQGGSTTQTVNVTGPRLTSADTTFTIAGFAKAKEFGDYGNSQTNQAAFTSGRSGRRKATSITKPWKSPRPWRQLQRKPEREFLLILDLRE